MLTFNRRGPRLVRAMIPNRVMKWLLEKCGVESLDELPEESYLRIDPNNPGVILDRNEDGSIFVSGPAVEDLYSKKDLPNEPPLPATFYKLESGKWGALVLFHNPEALRGRRLQISRKGVSTKAYERVIRVAKSVKRLDDQYECFCEITRTHRF